jgi:hypothetical protein
MSYWMKQMQPEVWTLKQTKEGGMNRFTPTWSERIAWLCGTEQMNDELMFMAKEFLNSGKLSQAVAYGNDSLELQTAIAEFGEEVLRMERARVEAGR